MHNKFFLSLGAASFVLCSVAAIELYAQSSARTELQNLSDIAVLSVARSYYGSVDESSYAGVEAKMYEIAQSAIADNNVLNTPVTFTLSISEYHNAEIRMSGQYGHIVLGHIGMGPHIISVDSKVRVPTREEIINAKKCRNHKSRYDVPEGCFVTTRLAG